MQFEPMVSIIIPVYNGSNFMREAIDSALEQTYHNIEVIVVNDGSCDDQKTAQIAQSYGNRIRYFEKENGGVSSALNLGIKEMKGEYFSWLSHDDKYYPNKIESEIKALSSLPDKHTVITCCCEFIDKESNLISKKKGESFFAYNEVLTWGVVLHALLKKGTMNGCALLIPKSIFESVGLFDENLRYNQDGFMWLKIFLKKYSMYCIPDVCVQSRLHSGQLTQTGIEIFHKDCESMSAFLIPAISEVTTPTDRYLFEYAEYNAKYGNDSVVKHIICSDKDLLNNLEKVKLKSMRVYGKIRPYLRKMYYRFFKLMRD